MARHVSARSYAKNGLLPPWVIPPQRPRPPVFTPEQLAELNKLIVGLAWMFMPADPRHGNRPTLNLGRLGQFVGTGAEILDAVREAVRAREAVRR